ncbi:hypothetical protein GOBAR_AA12998 [Gossypium barbadense]|uniref:SWIM-type domain-containing protein n=1 Tax=Gossypium barbadense TaxID=3634 RepID=A0A2P5XW98_GOSBA|nr:hypothetical protein GOBAR_AA12998 [Gossypium barbadense]
MAKGKLILVSRSRGKFTLHNDGSLSYIGEEAHALSINTESKFEDLKAEVAEMWNHDPDSLTIKYFLPHNNKTLITVSNDKDLQHLLDFHGNSAAVDVYVLTNENQTSDQLTMYHCRSGMVDEPVTPAASVSGATEQLDSSASLTTDVDNQNNFTPEAPNANALQKLVKSWENCLTGLEQRFNNAHDFRVALNKFSIAHGFEYTFKTNRSRYIIANCKAEGCPWTIQAARLSTTKLFLIKKMSETHTCGAGNSSSRHPKDYGFKARYAHVWRGVESAKEKPQVSYDEGYNQIPSLFKQIIENNPGSMATLVTGEDLSFHLLFVSLQASLHGFKNGYNQFENIRNISPEACEWILQSGPEHWSNALFQGSRYGYFSSNVAETFYSWVTELPITSIAKLIETICCKMMKLMNTQKSDSCLWLTKLTPAVEFKLEQHILKANMLQVPVSLGSTFEVCDSLGAINVVNIDLWDCSCREWQLKGFPCCHAVAVLQQLERSLYDYCSEYFTVDAFRSTYSNSINPIATADMAVLKKTSTIEVRPPALRHVLDPPKRRKKKYIHKGPFKRPLHCSKCQGAGHNRQTCHLFS